MHMYYTCEYIYHCGIRSLGDALSSHMIAPATVCELDSFVHVVHSECKNDYVGFRGIRGHSYPLLPPSPVLQAHDTISSFET